ncbi:helix-turn-helix domain-containing protein [Labilithrix luteola]|uniref:helix-turn-helix transcriptional regulator n=1 Tax=Labilithrix luteola TaxID=1391654 RepID=UPI0011BA9073
MDRRWRAHGSCCLTAAFDRLLPDDNIGNMTKPRFVPTHKRLALRLAERGWSQSDLSRELDLSRGTVSRWVSGKRTPTLKLAVKIEALLGIRVEDWEAPIEMETARAS